MDELSNCIAKVILQPLAYELGATARPYEDAIRTLAGGQAWDDMSQDSFSWTYLIYSDYACSLPEDGVKINQIAESGSFSYLAVYLSAVCSYGYSEQYDFRRERSGDWTVRRRAHRSPDLLKWFATLGYAVLDEHCVSMSVAGLGAPVPADAAGTVFTWLFGSGPAYGHLIPLIPLVEGNIQLDE